MERKFRITFQLKGKIYTQDINPADIDKDHYSKTSLGWLWDYWFETEDYDFEVNGQRDEHGYITPTDMQILVYLKDEDNASWAVDTDNISWHYL